MFHKVVGLNYKRDKLVHFDTTIFYRFLTAFGMTFIVGRWSVFGLKPENALPRILTTVIPSEARNLF